jgi:hypothetical protein
MVCSIKPEGAINYESHSKVLRLTGSLCQNSLNADEQNSVFKIKY